MLEQEPITAGIAADIEAEAIAAQPEIALLRPSQLMAWVKARKPELALLLGMTTTSVLVSGAALVVLLNPNLGKAIVYDPLIDEATLAASTRTSLGEQLLDQVARVLEIEIIETQGPGVGHRRRPVQSMVIVAQADQATAMPEADLAVGLKAMALAAGVGLGVTGLIRLMPRLPLSALGPRRRQPLSQRLTAAEIIDQPLAPLVAPVAVESGGDANGSRPPTQTLFPEALTSLAGLTFPRSEKKAAPAQKKSLISSAHSLWQGAIANLTPHQPQRTRMSVRDRAQATAKQTMREATTPTQEAKSASPPGQPAYGPEQGTASSPPAAGITQLTTPLAQNRRQAVDSAQAAQPKRSQSISFVPLSSLPLLSSPAASALKSGPPAKHSALLPKLSIGITPSRVLTSPVSARLDFLDDLNLRKQCHKA